MPYAAPAASAASVSHTVVGSGKLTLSLPKVVTAMRNGKAVAVRASVRGTARAPMFIDPSPNPSPGTGPCPNSNNLLDIYVNGQLVSNLDGLAGSNDSICVQATTDSTQTLAIPLYSTQSSQIVSIEFDATHSDILSIGETDYGTFSAGSAITLPALTMQMAAVGIGLTDLAFSSPVVMNGNSYND
jgi:hypothetical protein